MKNMARPKLFRLQDKTVIQEFVNQNLEFHNECGEKLSEVYSRYENFVKLNGYKNYDILKKRSFKSGREAWLMENYKNKEVEFRSTSSGVIIHGIGLAPERVLEIKN